MDKFGRGEPKPVREEQLGLQVCEEAPVYPQAVADAQKKGPALTEEGAPATPAMRLLDAVATILGDALHEPKSADEVAEMLNVAKTQAQVWLGELAKGGLLERFSKPVRYQVIKGADRLL